MAYVDRHPAFPRGRSGIFARTVLPCLAGWMIFVWALPANSAGTAETSAGVLDSRHGHNRHYPSPGSLVSSLPAGSRTVQDADNTYYYDSGVWYRASGTRFVVSQPLAGLAVPFLPAQTTTVWVGKVAHYYAGGVYYVWDSEQRRYVVAPAPAESDITPDSADIPDLLHVVPDRDQDPVTQADDRYRCHRWAIDQSDFDPAEPGGGVPPAAYSARRNDYRQALNDCLLASGYRALP